MLELLLGLIAAFIILFGIFAITSLCLRLWALAIISIVSLIPFIFLARFIHNKIWELEKEEFRRRAWEAERKQREWERYYQEWKYSEYRRSQEWNQEYSNKYYSPPPKQKQTEVEMAYKFFGLSYGSGAEEVKKTYRRLALIYHPDRGGNEEKFKQLSRYKDVLYKYLKI